MKQVVFFFDVDNTLLDNDRVTNDLKRHMLEKFDTDLAEQYWETFNELRKELGYADYLGALQRYRLKRPTDLAILRISNYLIDYPFANRLFPQSLDVVDQCNRWGKAAILSDGDVVFQPRKVFRSGLYDAMEKRVLIYIHKENNLEQVAALHPADHYVMFDDKVRLLHAMKKVWGRKLTTIFPRQGHYAFDEKDNAKYPAPDITIERIGDALQLDLDQIIAAGQASTA
jgi:FMN phosphatase YigB (HAD superfamily)